MRYFFRIWTQNTNSLEILIKSFKNFHQKIDKKRIILAYFSIEFNKPRINFLRV